ncbi:hypothetical protein RCH09_000007 [Actimicrobium sp. GrIS 1.19]|uniref:chalcone isomerase family protein n=1 Tax=Actimicrobium sp. GrIS 1.19 TaxID=3071708 RepID=UPI002E0236A6|nr:hypothetical protein [Actimicrobium sp. GrIS 1.19]
MIARLPLRLLGLLSGLLLAVSALAAPAHIEMEIPAARLSGEGTFRWFGLHIYDAQLWVGKRGYDAAQPEAAPLALDLQYARALNGRKIAESSRDQLDKLQIGSAQQRAEWLEKMAALFPDVQAGTHITGVFLPGLGARFYLDGKRLGEIADPAFARGFFAIWLDPKTTAPHLRKALLPDAPARQ